MHEAFVGQSLFGIFFIIGLAWLSSKNRQYFNGKFILVAIALQVFMAVVLLKLPLLADAMLILNSVVQVVEKATQEGTAMVFGFLGGGDTPYELSNSNNNFILAFRALPIVILFGTLSAILWHWRITPLIIKVISGLLKKSLGIGGAIGLGSASSVFVGMVESPLIIRHFLKAMSNSELFVLMSCGMATIAGTVMGLYGAILLPVLPTAFSHLIIASLISVPAAIALALIIYPQTSSSNTENLVLEESPRYNSTMHAITMGTQDGLRLFLNIIAMLIVFVALVNIVNQGLALLPFGDSEQPLTLQMMLGWLLQPLMWSLGIPWAEVETAGQLMSTKVILNELVAFLQLVQTPDEMLGDRSRIILTYALCGFANFGSLGIMIGGMTAICPDRSRDIIALAPLSIWSGMLSTCMTAAIIGLVI